MVVGIVVPHGKNEDDTVLADLQGQVQNVKGQVQNYLGAVANTEGSVYNQVMVKPESRSISRHFHALTYGKESSTPISNSDQV